MQRDSSESDRPTGSDDEGEGSSSGASSPKDAEPEKKERVIHTRVPAVLEQELKRLAENIRVPVSNLIRTILEDAVEMADRAGRGVEEELRHAASTLSSKRENILSKGKKKAQSAIGRTKANALDGVIGFQPLNLAADSRCAKCDAALDAGEEANLGVSADPTAPRVVVCNECLPRSRGSKKEKPK
jgi:hypothetical protein